MNILPDSPPPPQRPAPDLDDLLWREVQMMQAAGWTLHQRWPGGADFSSVTKGGFPIWAHLLLVVLTLGVWLPFMLLIELTSSAGKHKFCRLAFNEHGQPTYAEIGRPQTSRRA